MLSRRGRATLIGLVVVAAIVALLYTNGRLDPLLYRFGLNHNPCTHTLSGSIVCGPDIAGTPFSAGGGGASGGGGQAGGGQSGNPVGGAGGVGKATGGSLGGSAGSAP